MPKRRLFVVLLAVLASLLATTYSAEAAMPAKYYAIGDSVMIDATPSLHRKLPSMQVNAAVSRQVSDGIALLQAKKRNHSVAAITIFGLGTNGTLTTAQMRQIVNLTAGHKLVMVTSHCPYCSWTNGNNSAIRSWCTAAHHCWIAPFAAHAAYHPEWFTGDGVHMAQYSTGANQYAYYVWLACHNAHRS